MPVLAFIQNVGPWQLLIILLIVFVLFGAGKLPQVFESLGKGMKAFRDAQRDDDAIDVGPKEKPAELTSDEHLDSDEDAYEEVVVRRKKKNAVER